MELKNCPFCGGEAVIGTDNNDVWEDNVPDDIAKALDYLREEARPMYINPFLAGILSTILFELLVSVGIAIVSYRNDKRK